MVALRIAPRHRLGAQASKVGAGIGFRIALAPHMLAAEDARQKALLLFGRAVLDEQRADHHDALVGRARHAVLLQLLDPRDELVRRQAHAAVRLRPGRRDPALRREREVPLANLAPARAVRQVAQLRRITLLQKAAHHAAELGLGHGGPVGGACQELAMPGGRATGRRFGLAGQRGMPALVRRGIAQPRRQAQHALVEQAQVALLRVADGPVQLHRRARRLQRGSRATRVDAAGLGFEPVRRQGAVACQRQHFVQRGLRHLEVDEHVDAAVLQRLEAADGLAELRARAQVGQGLRQHRLPCAEQLRGLQDLSGRERLAQRLLRGRSAGQHGVGRQHDLFEAQVGCLAAVDQRHDRLAHAGCAARHPQQHGIVLAARRHQPAAGGGAGQHHELVALQQHAAPMTRARLAAAGQRHGAEVARAFLPGQRGQATARHQLGQQGTRRRRVEPSQQQRAQARHGQQWLGRRVLADRAQNFCGAVEPQRQAAGRFGRQHAGPAERGDLAPALRLVGLRVFGAGAASRGGAAAGEVVERRFAHGQE
ncbi:hypothetical protein D9M68_579480 [compost metagenome]